MFLRAYESYAADMRAEAAQALAHPDAARALRDYFDHAIRSMTTGVPTRGCLTTKTAIDTKAGGEAIRAALRRLIDDLERLLRERLSTGEARARLAIPPAEAARVLITMTRGIVVMERVYQDPGRLRATASSLIDALLPPA
ncbi:TetR/AcrR family transcriptional regulator [Nonomuraea sp. K274]|uniref:TetR/AcrR family transcriptional regulator n=1 Tax=Nonomuraea cypriaca TaxID=1187855 RepID=A0A931ABW8_9ACTN|nr:TetR/AcrR family transcriptional regulator [Nonomuraea cypriaca]MBF8187165.1 TetR/AcrR family transcriptional regulator [Nonomuraea cypriaca]